MELFPLLLWVLQRDLIHTAHLPQLCLHDSHFPESCLIQKDRKRAARLLYSHDVISPNNPNTATALESTHSPAPAAPYFLDPNRRPLTLAFKSTKRTSYEEHCRLNPTLLQVSKDNTSTPERSHLALVRQSLKFEGTLSWGNTTHWPRPTSLSPAKGKNSLNY